MGNWGYYPILIGLITHDVFAQNEILIGWEVESEYIMTHLVIHLYHLIGINHCYMIQEAKWWVFVVALRLSGDFIMEINRYIPQIPPRKRRKRPQVVNNPVLRPDFLGGWHWGCPTRRCCSKPPFNQSFFSTGSCFIYFIVGCTTYCLPPKKGKLNQGKWWISKAVANPGNTNDPKNWNTMEYQDASTNHSPFKVNNKL